MALYMLLVYFGLLLGNIGKRRLLRRAKRMWIRIEERILILENFHC